MNKEVKFRVDGFSEMLEVYVGGKLVSSGNFWDFDFVEDVPDLLQQLGINVEVEEYVYNDGFTEEEE